jgi:hypothetical protein
VTHRWQNPAVNAVFAAKIVLTAGFLLIASFVQAESWRFAVIGDTPYTAQERRELPALLDAIGQSGVAFVAHIGDFKSGNTPCDDARFEDRRQMFNASRIPFVYIPGDNDWCDCHRASNGAMDPQERLRKLRSLFWPDERSLGHGTLIQERQSAAYPEHARFRIGPVLVLTLNVPGGNNNRGLADKPSAEFAERNPQIVRWLKEGFALARAQKLRGIVVMMQANADIGHFNIGAPLEGYRDLLETLRSETENFPGEVLLVHGDTHFHRIDHPLLDQRGREMKKLTRLESYGYPFMGWAEVQVEAEGADVFRITSHPWPTTGRSTP